MSTRSWGMGFSEMANKAKEAAQEAAAAVQEAAEAAADAFEPRGAAEPRAAPALNIGFAEAPPPPGGQPVAAVAPGGGDLLALFQPGPQPEPEPEAEPNPDEPPQRVFNVVIMPGILIDRDRRVYVSASTLDGLHAALAERLEITEKFQIWQLDPLHGDASGELRLVDSLDRLGDAIRVHLELSDEALSQRTIDAANAQVFDQIKADMASYMEGAGPTAKFDTWLKDSVWMRDTGGARDENGVPLRAAGSVVRELWDQEAAWQEEKRKDREAFDAQSRSGALSRERQEAEFTFALKVCRGGVHAGGAEDVVVSSPDRTVRGLVVNICRRLKIPLEDDEELVLSIGNGDMCRVVRSLDQLPHSCPVQLWRAGSGPDAAGGRASFSGTKLPSPVTAQLGDDASAAAGRLQSQLQLAVTHPDIRRALSSAAVEKHFPKEGSATTPPHEHDGFLFTTHMTDVFAQIRENQGIDPQLFFVPMMSLHAIPNPGGKSGASFYTTADGSFFFKSVTRQEFAFLSKILPELAQRLKLREFVPEAIDAPRSPGDPTPGSSAWIKAQQAQVSQAAGGLAAALALTASTKVHYPLGTVLLGQLAEYEAAGKLDEATPVWVAGMEEWQPLQQVRSMLLGAMDALPPPQPLIAAPSVEQSGGAIEPASSSQSVAQQHSAASDALVDMGFTRAQSDAALELVYGSVDRAVELIASGALDDPDAAEPSATPTEGREPQAPPPATATAEVPAPIDLLDRQLETQRASTPSAAAAGGATSPGGSESLLPTFMALYSVCGLGALGGFSDTQRLVVMRNGLPPSSPSGAALSYIFDLKGSTRGRRASASEREAAGALSRVTLKDLDWRERFVTPVMLKPRSHQRLMAMLRADIKMLAELGVVDFSLLLGVHVTSMEQSRLLPPPPSSLEAGQQTADVETRASAEAAAFKANFDVMRLQTGWTDAGMMQAAPEPPPLSAAPAVVSSVEPETEAGAGDGTAASATPADGGQQQEDDDADDDEQEGDSCSSGCKWVRGSAVVRSQAEERLCQLEISVSVVDVLSSGSQALKAIEAFKNKAMYESAASVVPAPEYSSRFLEFCEQHVFAQGGEEYGLL
jgi:hypothetical protein